MSYIALYRAYRPKTFDEVAGQKTIVQTLKNAIIHQKIAHAYLFSGPRGTGKTSIAKIFAKAVNCLNPNQGNPCQKCDVCKGIEQGDISDVIEIDAASNNGVDEIRELRDKAKYMPSIGKYKVYIIDEVHMLSSGAFNALLKTLEEPPKHVIFILATTEIHKIPATILSRCQRFDFKNIELDDMLYKLKEIIDLEKIIIDDDAIMSIAKSAEGGLRDALSLLDQARSFSSDHITAEDVSKVSGSVSLKQMEALIESLVKKDYEKASSTLDILFSEGKEAGRIVLDLIMGLKEVLLTHLNINRQSRFAKYKNDLSKEKIYYYIEVLNQLQNDMKFTQQKRTFIELAFIRLMHHQESLMIDQEATIRELKRDIEQLKQWIKDENNRPRQTQATKKVAKKSLVDDEMIKRILISPDKEKRQLLAKGWEHLKHYPNKLLELIAYQVAQTTLVAASTDSEILLTSDDLVLCYSILDAKNKKDVLKIFNSKQKLVKDFTIILKKDWDKVVSLYKIEKEHIDISKMDFGLYQKDKKQNEERENETISLAKEYFGDIVIVKE